MPTFIKNPFPDSIPGLDRAEGVVDRVTGQLDQFFPDDQQVPGYTPAARPTENAYLAQLKEGELEAVVTFDYLPQTFSETKSANYSNINVIGRSEPIAGYAHSGPRVFQISLVFAANSDAEKEVLAPVRLLRSWLYPDYSTPSVPQTPPPLLFGVGKWLEQRVILLRADVKYHGPFRYSVVNGQSSDNYLAPMWAEVGVAMQEVAPTGSDTPYGTHQVRIGADRSV